MTTREEPAIVNNRWEEDTVILGAILDIQSAIQRIAPFARATGYQPGISQELSAAVAELEQAVRWLKGES